MPLQWQTDFLQSFLKGENKTASRQKSFSFKWWLCAVAIAYGWLQTVKKYLTWVKITELKKKSLVILSPRTGHNNIKPFHWAWQAPFLFISLLGSVHMF